MTDDAATRILEAINDLRGAFGEVRAGQERLEARQARLEANQERLEARQARLEANQERLEVRQDRLESKLDTTRADIMDRIDRVQHKVDQTHDDIIVNFGNTDRVERVARTAMDDNRTTTEILRVMQRQIMRLQTDVDQLKGAA